MDANPFHPTWRQRRLADFDYSDPDCAYFVTVCARKGTAPFTDSRLAAEVVKTLHWLRSSQGITLYAFCLMPDHLHLLLRLGTSEEHALGQIVGSLKQFTTKRSWQLGYTGHLWQARFYDHILRRSEHGASIAAYILDNPVRKGLVEDASAYPYSGLPDPM
jgi:REP element-mobilizing transposase RayT